ncbi:hypothetical protein FB561_0324 [Kribbella amoyensis]|uniref:Uncharacterized protein n=1 Tax=Kribbella amoyensis TaxID=996641 RepID=A0A561BK61_9ACTN|nr:hypothetical protein [Kribbella amoyensis]TWD79268.1 hypothetical protein FB561_0324 [Kribbella amoyensis]
MRAVTLQETPRRWPAYVIAVGIGLFCVVVLAIAGGEQLLTDKPMTSDGLVAIGATVLRIGTIALALAAVTKWDRILPARLMSMALWAVALGQLAYPAAETVVKAAILLDLMEPVNKGISNMSAVGWFNFGAAWLVWGVPGCLFTLLALDHRRRHQLSWVWAPLGAVGGLVALGALGFLIS